MIKKKFKNIMTISIYILTHTIGLCNVSRAYNLPFNNVFAIEAYENGSLSEGTGFAISQVGDKLNIVTAKHVIENADSIFVYSYNSNVAMRTIREIKHRSLDIAVITINARIKDFPSYIVNPDISDSVSFIKAQSNWEISNGEKSGYIKNVSNVSIIINDLIIEAGDSGGPVFSREGIIGMVSSTGRNTSTSLDIININVIKNVIVNDWRIAWQLDSCVILRKKLFFSSNITDKLISVNVVDITIKGNCTGNPINIIDNNLNTAWKCKAEGTTDIYFYFDHEYAITEFMIYQAGFVDKTNEDIPEGYFKISSKDYSMHLNKLMSFKEVEASGTWVTYRFKKNVVTKEFYLSLHTNKVFTSAIYEVKVNGFNL